MAAFPGLAGTWAQYSGSTASIRVPASSGTGTVLECFSMEVTGEGSARVLTVVWLGGSGFTVANQCGANAISLSPNGFTSPYCASLPGSNSPYQSTIIARSRKQKQDPPVANKKSPPPPPFKPTHTLTHQGTYSLSSSSGAAATAAGLAVAGAAAAMALVAAAL